MIFFGYRTKAIGAKPVSAICGHCGTDTHVLVGTQKYFHLYWIPTLPAGKSVSAVCAHCKLATTSKSLPEGLRSQAESYRRELRTPPKTFLGLALIALAVVIGYASTK